MIPRVVDGRIVNKQTSDSYLASNAFNSLTAMDAHERPLFIELCGTVVSRRVFIRSQSLIASRTRNDSSWPLLLAICTRLAESMTSVEGQNRIFFGLVNIRRFVCCVAR